MRTPAAAVTAFLAAGLLAGCAGSSSSDYRVDAVFDSAKGLVPGQLVKIAGARVGKITDVQLTTRLKAKVTMSIPRRFAPFHADASCQILPEGIISEKYVDCSPGSPTRSDLTETDGTPTVPLGQTKVPVSIQDLFDIFSVPTSQRLRVAITELGIGTAGRGGDLNAILRRANPALEQARNALAIVHGQNAQLASAVTQTDTILGVLARRRRAVGAFVDRGAALAGTTAAHAPALHEATVRLPVMLQSLRRALPSLDRFTTDATPLLRRLRQGAPQLSALTRTLPAFARAGTPAVTALATAATRTRAAISTVAPVIHRLRRLAVDGRPVLGLSSALLDSLRDRGGSEYLLRLIYRLASVTSAYDSVSHMIGLYVFVAPECVPAPKSPGCSHAYTAPGHGRVPINDAAASAKRDTPSSTRALLDYLLK